jgi:hypothetical protein
MAVRKYYFVFGLMAIINEPLELAFIILVIYVRKRACMCLKYCV